MPCTERVGGEKEQDEMGGGAGRAKEKERGVEVGPGFAAEPVSFCV